jgi:hypothetical protein
MWHTAGGESRKDVESFLEDLLADTELDQGRRPSHALGIPAADMAGTIVQGMERDQKEIPLGEAAGRVDASRKDLDGAFRRINKF